MVDPGRTDPETYYDDYGERGWERLDRNLFHRLKWEAVDRLDAHLPPADGPGDSPHVLDVGGGTGRYSVHLAERGYEVTLVDLSGTQREIAREKLREAGVDHRVTVRAGDVRDLEFEAGVRRDLLSGRAALARPRPGGAAGAARDLRRVPRPAGQCPSP